MNEPHRPPIEDLLRDAEANAITRDFAVIHVQSYHRACAAALLWQRTQGRALVLAGGDPDLVAQTTQEQREARDILHGQLTCMLAWAKDTNRLADKPHDD